METACDKINILLIDDDPEGLWKRDPTTRGLPAYPGISSAPGDAIDRSTLFDVRWIATPEEAREFRDLSRLIGEHEPAKLQRDGWVPEVVVVDYLLKASA